MSVLIIGNRGSMGQRYSCILKHLGKTFVGVDKGDVIPDIQYDGYIIATPTETHAKIVCDLAKYRKPILIEKPICKDIDRLKEILWLFSNEKIISAKGKAGLW